MGRRVTFVWKADFELPEGMDSVPSTLDGFPPEFLEEVEPTTAELVDWY